MAQEPYKHNMSEEKKTPQTEQAKAKPPKRKLSSILTIVFNSVVAVFCALVLTPLLYFFAESTVSSETVTARFSIDWTIFGIFIAAAGMMIAVKQNKKVDRVEPFVKVQLIVILIESLVSCLMLFITTFFVFAGNEKLFMSATFSTLYLLSFLFINCIFLLATFVADEWIFKN